MQEIGIEEFLRWAQSRGVRIDERHPGQYLLRFSIEPEERRFWTIPRKYPEYSEEELNPSIIVHQMLFLTHFLNALDEWQTCGLLKRNGDWPVFAEPETALLLESLGISRTTSSALMFDRAERPALTLLLLTLTALGWCVDYDVWVVPDHGRQMLFLDHDDVLHAEFPTAEERMAFTSRLEAVGIHLPTKPPNMVFDWKEWMEPKPDEGQP